MKNSYRASPGPEQLLQGGQKHAQPVSYRLLSFDPSRLRGFPFLGSTVPLFPIHNIIVEITLRNKFPFYYIFSVPLTHLDTRCKNFTDAIYHET